MRLAGTEEMVGTLLFVDVKTEEEDIVDDDNVLDVGGTELMEDRTCDLDVDVGNDTTELDPSTLCDKEIVEEDTLFAEAIPL